MRKLVIALSMMAAVSMTATAEASRDKGKPRHHGYGSYDSHDARHGSRSEKRYRARRQSADSEADIIRAESCDPAGRFDGYPAWARAAFTCGSQR